MQAERDRQTAFAEAEAEHEKKVKAEAERVATQHAEVDSFRESYEQRNPEALVTYCSLVLAASQYPDAFPQQYKIAYVPESRQLVIEMDLPTLTSSRSSSSTGTSKRKTRSPRRPDRPHSARRCTHVSSRR